MNQKLEDTKQKEEMAAFYDIQVRITVHDYVSRKEFALLFLSFIIAHNYICVCNKCSLKFHR
jgi:hypothetical protein